MHNTLYFGGEAIGGAILVLAVYALAGVALLVGFATHCRPNSPLENNVEVAAPAAAGAA